MSRVPEDGDAGAGRLSGWSRRKLAARRSEAGPPDQAVREETRAPSVADAGSGPDDVDADYIAALPSIETVVQGSDIKPFLARGVPSRLKNAALRRLWSATPGVRDYSDPAVDYAWDWNAPGGVPGGGGTLSECGVAKMVKDLIGGSRAEDEDAAADADPERREPAPEVKAPQKEAAPAIRRTEKRQEAESGTQPERPRAPEGARSIAASIPPPRRHGGAVPE